MAPIGVGEQARVPRPRWRGLVAARVPVVAPSGLQARVQAAGIEHTTPYALRHSFASLLLHEGRSVIYVARQLGHDARLTLSRYGHVIDELDEQPRIDAETAIQEARVPSQFPEALENGLSPNSKTPETRVEAANSGRWS